MKVEYDEETAIDMFEASMGLAHNDQEIMTSPKH